MEQERHGVATGAKPLRHDDEGERERRSQHRKGATEGDRQSRLAVNARRHPGHAENDRQTGGHDDHDEEENERLLHDDRNRSGLRRRGVIASVARVPGGGRFLGQSRRPMNRAITRLGDASIGHPPPRVR